MEDIKVEDIKAVLVYRADGKTKKYKSLEEAEAKTGVSKNRILYCIKSGQRWRTFLFDYI